MVALGAEHQRHYDVPVLAGLDHRVAEPRHDLEWAAARLTAVVAEARRILSERGVASHEEQRPHDGGLHRSVQMLALAAPIALVQREDRVGGCLHRSVHRGLAEAQRDRGSILVSHHREQPTRSGQDQVRGLTRGVRHRLAEGRHRDVDELRVLAAQRVASETQAVEGSRRKRLDQNVGGSDEFDEANSLFGRLEIEDDGSLAEPPGPPEERALRISFAALLVGGREAGITAPGRLDLDDLGAQVGEDPAGTLSEPGREIEYPDAFERSRSLGVRRGHCERLHRESASVVQLAGRGTTRCRCRAASSPFVAAAAGRTRVPRGSSGASPSDRSRRRSRSGRPC